jgi:hypothetical protein
LVSAKRVGASPLVKRLAAAGLCLLGLLPGSVSALEPSPSPSDPGEIFDRARAAWRSQEYPQNLRYRIVIRYTLEGRALTQTHEALWNADSRRAVVKAISAEELENPYRPRGTNWFGLNKEFHEPFGVPELSPVYSFGLRSRLRMQAPPPTPEPSGGPREIASVRIVARDYKVSFLGAEPCEDATPAYHLGLEPYRKPQNYPLRELWVRESDYTTCRLRVAKNFDHSPIGEGPWEITFAQHDGFGTTIAREHPLEPVRYQGKPLEDVSIAFENLAAAKPGVAVDLWNLGLSGTDGETTREPEEL